MATDELDIDPLRAPGAFIFGLTQLRVANDGLEPGRSVEVIDVMAALGVAVTGLTVAECAPGESIQQRSGVAR